MTFARRFGFLALSLVAAMTALSGCQRSSVISIPPPPPPRFYVGNFVSGNIQVFNQPLVPTSVPAFALATGHNVGGLAVDSAGNLYVGNGTQISVYAPPTTSTSVPTSPGVIAGAGNLHGLAFDKAGNLWVADPGSVQVFEFTLPLTNVPKRTIQCACFSFPFSLSFDLGNHIFVGDEGSSSVNVLSIPSATGLSVLTAVAVIASPSASGVAVDSHGTLYAGDFAGGEINAFTPPYGTGMPISFSFGPPGVLNTPEQMLFDSSGNLYVAYESDTTVTPTGGFAIFAPPALTPVLVIQGAATGFDSPFAVGFAP